MISADICYGSILVGMVAGALVSVLLVGLGVYFAFRQPRRKS